VTFSSFEPLSCAALVGKAMTIPGIRHSLHDIIRYPRLRARYC